MNIRNESRSGSLFFWLESEQRFDQTNVRIGPTRTNVRFLGAGAGHARISCRSYAIRPGALYEQAFAAGDTPGSVGRGAGAAHVQRDIGIPVVRNGPALGGIHIGRFSSSGFQLSGRPASLLGGGGDPLLLGRSFLCRNGFRGDEDILGDCGGRGGVGHVGGLFADGGAGNGGAVLGDSGGFRAGFVGGDIGAHRSGGAAGFTFLGVGLHILGFPVFGVLSGGGTTCGAGGCGCSGGGRGSAAVRLLHRDGDGYRRLRGVCQSGADHNAHTNRKRQSHCQYLSHEFVHGNTLLSDVKKRIGRHSALRGWHQGAVSAVQQSCIPAGNVSISLLHIIIG